MRMATFGIGLPRIQFPPKISQCLAPILLQQSFIYFYKWITSFVTLGDPIATASLTFNFGKFNTQVATYLYPLPTESG